METSGQHFIQGSWIEGMGENLVSLDPATGEAIWTGKHATQKEVDQAVSAAKEAAAHWGRLAFEERLSFLLRYEKVLADQRGLLEETISQETGKPLWESSQEVQAMIQKIPISIDAYHERCPEKKINIEPATTLAIHHKPHGAVAVMGPFNFPGHLPNGHLVPALLAGNTVVFKGSEFAPKTAELIIRCLEKAELPSGVINLIQGGPSTGHSLTSHPLIDGIFFTGSCRTGLQLLEAFHQHPEKILALEMGGNNPLVLWDAADLEAAAFVAIQSAYLTSGQRCSAARRLILPFGREGDEFLKIFIHMIDSIQVGKYTDRPQPFMGPVISMESKEKLINAQACLGAQGGESLVEMRSLNDTLPFLSPGLMDVTKVAHRTDEELFGPFLQLIRVNTFEEAIHEGNNTGFGLTASLISRHPEKFQQFFHSIKAGVINWNAPTTGASSRAPFGGVGKSGNHRPGAYYAADYSAYPVASMESAEIHLPKERPPGITFLART